MSDETTQDTMDDTTTEPDVDAATPDDAGTEALAALDAELDDWQQPAAGNLDHHVSIPVLVNWRPVAADETLKFYKEAEKEKEAQKPPKFGSITVGAAIKRRATQTEAARAKKPKK